jgi:hypothetical protein
VSPPPFYLFKCHTPGMNHRRRLIQIFSPFSFSSSSSPSYENKFFSGYE